MQQEIKLKYYNEYLKIGFNSPRDPAYDVSSGQWLQPNVHAGRLVYGKDRIPYSKITSNITHRNFVAVDYCPF